MVVVTDFVLLTDCSLCNFFECTNDSRHQTSKYTLVGSQDVEKQTCQFLTRPSDPGQLPSAATAVAELMECEAGVDLLFVRVDNTTGMRSTVPR
jgi:hypothetical protein